jgi:hypothetical protein
MATPKRNRMGRFVAGARSAAGKVRTVYRTAVGKGGRTRRAYGAARSAVRSARKSVSLWQTEYVMGPKPKALWGLWLFDTAVDPILGGGQMSDTRPSAYQVWKATKDLSKAYEAFKDRLSLNESGYSTKDGRFYGWDDPKVLRGVKSAVAPIASTGIDWGLSWFVGQHPPRIMGKALVGHRRKK